MPLGAITIIAGNPGIGKSFLTLDLAARASRGRPMPHCVSEPDCDSKCDVLLISAEDDPERTIRPRLEKMDADLIRIHILDGVNKGNSDGPDPLFSLDTHLEALRRELDANNQIRLIVIDPLNAYVGGDVDAHRDASVRTVLHPLTKLVNDKNVALLAVMHLNKNATGQDAIHRVGGSVGFVAAARSAILVAQDPNDKERKLFLPMKHNLAEQRPPGLAYTLDDGTVAWEEGEIQTSADEVLAPASRTATRPSQGAAARMQQILADGPVASTEVLKTLKAEGHSQSTVSRVKKKLGIRSRKRTVDGKARWYLELKNTKSPKT